MEYKVEKINRVVHRITMRFLSSEKHKTLLISDVHFDSVNCDRELLEKHLKECDTVFINGDWFDLMQGRYDPRRSYNDIQDKYKGDNYINPVLEDAVRFLGPYAHKIIGFGHGNHETTYLKNNNYNILQALVDILNNQNKTNIQLMGYAGYLLFSFTRNNINSNKCVRVYKIKHHHGSRGNAKRSKDILHVDIDAMKWPDADIIIKGDSHHKWHYPAVVRERLVTKNGVYEIKDDVQHQFRLGSYVDGVGDGYGGWAVEKDFHKQKKGGWFIEWYHHNHEFKFTVLEAD